MFLFENMFFSSQTGLERDGSSPRGDGLANGGNVCGRNNVNHVPGIQELLKERKRRNWQQLLHRGRQLPRDQEQQQQLPRCRQQPPRGGRGRRRKLRERRGLHLINLKCLPPKKKQFYFRSD